jgi:predicted ribosome quality control (RQC) complex YloA/Tae2 family protein
VRFENVNALVADYFTGHLRAMRLRRRREQLLVLLERRWERLRRREQELRPAEGDETAEIAALQATGDRLLAAYGAGEVSREGPGGLREVCLARYESGESWVIAVEPAAGWVENAQIYYRRARKAKARQALRRNMAEPLRDALTFLENLCQLAAQADTLAELEAIAADLDEAGLALPGEGRGLECSGSGANPGRKSGRNGKPSGGRGGNGGKRAEDTLPAGVVQLRSSDGLELLLGKSAQGNDAIVGRLSRADDVWLHVHQMPGSHVLIRTGKASVPAQTLEEAARLAAYYSAARHSVNVPVIYAPIRYVRKIPHSYPGHVTYREEKTIFVTPKGLP